MEDKEAVVRAWFDGLARGELSLDLLHPEVEIRNWAESPAAGPYVGHEGARRWWSDVQDSLERVRFELAEVLEAGGDRVVTVQHIVGRFRHTGIELDHRWGSVVAVRGGLIASATGYSSPGRARRAAGLA